MIKPIFYTVTLDNSRGTKTVIINLLSVNDLSRPIILDLFILDMQLI